MEHSIIVAKVKTRVNEAIVAVSKVMVLKSYNYFKKPLIHRDECVLRQCILNSYGFEFLGWGAARNVWSLTVDGVKYAIKFDRMSEEEIDQDQKIGMAQSEPESLGNLADWCNQQELVKLYPQIKPNLALILGGFDCDVGLVLVQEYVHVDTGATCHAITSDFHHRKFLNMIDKLTRDVMENIQNFTVVDGQIKIIDLDRLSFKRMTSPKASNAVREYYAHAG